MAVGVDQSSHSQCTLWVSLSILRVVSEGRGCLTMRAPRGVQGVGGLADKATLDAPLDVAHTFSLCMHRCSLQHVAHSLIAHEVREEWSLLALMAQWLKFSNRVWVLSLSNSRLLCLSHTSPHPVEQELTNLPLYTQPVQYHKWSSPVGPVVWGGSASTS